MMLINYYYPLSFFYDLSYSIGTVCDSQGSPESLSVMYHRQIANSCRHYLPTEQEREKEKAEGARPEEEIKTGRKMGILTSLPSIPKQHLLLMVLFFYNASNQY